MSDDLTARLSDPKNEVLTIVKDPLNDAHYVTGSVAHDPDEVCAVLLGTGIGTALRNGMAAQDVLRWCAQIIKRCEPEPPEEAPKLLC